MSRLSHSKRLLGISIAAGLVFVTACSSSSSSSKSGSSTTAAPTTTVAGSTATTVAVSTSVSGSVTTPTSAPAGSVPAGTDTATSAPAGTGVPAVGGVAEAEALVAAAMKPITFAPPAGVGPIDFTKVKGKTVAIINLAKAVPILTQWEAEMTTALTGSGIKLTSVDGKFDPNEWGRGIESAIADKADLIFLLGVPPTAVKPQIAEAKAAGIPIMASLQGEAGTSLTAVPDLAADVGFDYKVPGKLLADWFVADSKGKGKALIFSSDDNTSSPFVWGAMKAEIDRLCPHDCSYTIKDTTVPEWSDGTLQQRTKALLQADPSITHILAVYDGMTLAIEPALVELGVDSKVRVAGFNGTPAVVANVQGKTAVKMDVGNPNMWFSAGADDAILKTLTGGKPIQDPGVKFRIFTADNVTGIDTTKEDDVNWFGLDPLTGYRTLWGLKG